MRKLTNCNSPTLANGSPPDVYGEQIISGFHISGLVPGFGTYYGNNHNLICEKYCSQAVGPHFEPIPNMFSCVNGAFIGLSTTPESCQMQYQPNSFYPLDPTMRTIYIGDLAEGTTISDIADKIHVGSLEQIKIIPEKNCAFVTFIDPGAAYLFYMQAKFESLRINGCEVKIGSGKPSAPSPLVMAALESGASRTVYIGNINANVTDQYLRSEFGKIGPVDSINIISEKKIAFVHMSSIMAAKKSISTLLHLPEWATMKLNYGRDRCDMFSKNVHKNYTLFDMLEWYINRLTGIFPLISSNRTIYIGNIQPDVTIKELCDIIRGGILQNIKYIKDKNIAFATFISHTCALRFYIQGSLNLSLRGKKLRLGWGKPSPLPSIISEAIKHGASRSVYIGSIDETITEDKLRKDFGEFGEIEFVSIMPKKSIGFVSYLDIISSINAVEMMKSTPEYSKFRINFGKDRCRGWLEPSYRDSRNHKLYKRKQNQNGEQYEENGQPSIQTTVAVNSADTL